MSRGLRMARGAVALVLLSALGAVFAAPLALARDDAGAFCARGRCCCAPGAPEERTCLRSVCGCRGGGGEPALLSLGEAVLPALAAAPRPEGVRAVVMPALALPAVPDRAPPDHPPPHS